MRALYDDLPEDPEEAFLVLEERFREDRDHKAGDNFDPQQYFPADAYLEYMQRCASAAEELGLGFANDLRVPAVGNLHWDSVRLFQGDLHHHLTRLNIRRARRDGGFSVKFDTTAKSKITHYITQIREMILRMELDDWKREGTSVSAQRLTGRSGQGPISLSDFWRVRHRSRWHYRNCGGADGARAQTHRQYCRCDLGH
jgi:hypothetical protein